MSKDHLTTKSGGTTTGGKVNVLHDWQTPTQKTDPIGNNLPAVKELANKPLHDAKTHIIGKELRQKKS